MEDVLEKTKQAVEKYRATSQSDSLKANRALCSAISACRNDLREQEKTDRGVTQRVARELTEMLATLPIFRGLMTDPEVVHKLHNRRSAEAHIEQFESHIQSIVKQLEEGREKEIVDWIKTHPVLGPLKKAIRKRLPENAYVLLFVKGADGSPELLRKGASEGRVFTRYKQHDFKNDHALYKTYAGKRDLVGAALIADDKLEAVIGSVPEPAPGQEQLRVLTGLSKQAASEPARAFVESNPVLSVLHELCKDRKMDKEAYILLFSQKREESEERRSGGKKSRRHANRKTEVREAPTDELVDGAPADESVGEEAREEQVSETTIIESATEETAAHESNGEAVVESNAGEEAVAESAADEEPPAEPATEETTSEPTTAEETAPEPTTEETTSEPADDSATDEDIPPTITDEDEDSKPKIVTRAGSGGGVLTRFYGLDFIDTRKIFDTFRGPRTICGAAIVKGNQLVDQFGTLPKPKQGEQPLQTLLRESNYAVDEPIREFLAENEILGTVHKLATDQSLKAESEVVLFIESEGGKLVPVLSQSRDKKNQMSKITGLLGDFRVAKVLKDKFKHQPKIVGASIIGEAQLAAAAPSKPQSKDKKDFRGDSRGDFRRGERPPSKRVVLAAYGKTPLKQNILLTQEILARLGIDL